MIDLNGRKRSIRFVCVWLIACQLGGFAAPALANPRGGVVVGGSAVIDQTNAALTRITQGTDKAIINWQGFSNKVGETIRFAQPSSSAVALNRVVSQEPSVIQGALQANGQVFLVNPSGVVFSKTAEVDVGGMVATSLQMRDDDFMRGHYKLEQEAGKPMGAVVNHGRITAADKGKVALVAPFVANEGRIQARAGRIALASGTRAVVSLDDEGLVNLSMGRVQGDVRMPAEAATSLVRRAVSNRRIVEAGEIREESDGTVVLGRSSGVAINGGTLDVDGAPGVKAGSVRVVSEHASLVAPGAVVSANGVGERSSGGDIRVLSQRTSVLSRGALLSARGGTTGDGGFVEVSGSKDVVVDGDVDTRAPGGKMGTFLIDPDDIVIINGAGGADDVQLDMGVPAMDPEGQLLAVHAPAGTATISEVKIESLTAGTNIILEANNTITLNDLTTDGVLTLPAGANLTLRTLNGDITFQNPANTILASGAGTITIAAGTAPGGNANAIVGDLVTAGGMISVSSGNASGNITIGTLDAGAGSVLSNSPAGQIIDGNAAADNVVAANATLLAFSGIGAADDLETRIGVLNASTDVGDIRLFQLGVDIVLNSVTAATGGGTGNVSIFSGGGDISLGLVTAANDTVIIQTVGGSILDTDGDLDLQAGTAGLSALNTIGFGNALETDVRTSFSLTSAAAGGITINNTAAPALNALNVSTNSALDAVAIQASAGNSLTVAAGVMTGTAVGTNTTFSAAAGNYTLASVSTGVANLSITALTGSIADDAVAATRVTAGNLTLAGTDVAGADALETAVASLTANASAGSVNIDELDAISLSNLTAVGAGNDVTVLAGGTMTVGVVNAPDAATLTSTVGQIADGNGVAANVSAGAGTFTAGTSIGTAADPLETALATLTATANSGGVFVAEADAITLTSVTALGAGSDVVISTTAGTIGVGAIVAAGDAVTLTAGGAASAITDGDGTTDITAASATLSADADIGGPADRLDTDVDSLSATVTGGLGSVFLQEANAVTIGSATSVGPGSGVDIVNLAGDITLGQVSSQTAVTIVAAGGLIDGNGAANNITAPGASLASGTGIGAGNALETTISWLMATATAGNIEIAETDGLTVMNAMAGGAAPGDGSVVITTATGNLDLLAVTALGDSVTLVATAGAITDGDAGGPDISAATASLTAGTTIGVGGTDGAIDTTVGSLSAVTGAGNIVIMEADGVTLTSVTAGGALVGDGSITIDTTTGSLSLGTITAQNDVISLSANGAGGQLIDVNAGANNLSANLASLNSDAGIGAGDALETQVSSVLASTSTGNIELAEADGADLAGVLAGGDAIVSTATGNLNVGAITGTNATLTAAAGALVDNNGGALNIDVGAGSVTLSAATGIGAADALETTMGTLASATSATGNVQIVETDGATLTSVSTGGAGAGDGSVVISTTAGSLSVGSITAQGDAINLSAPAGAITDANGGALNVFSTATTLAALTGIALDTRVDTLIANSTGAGNVTIIEQDGVTVLGANAGTAALADGDFTLVSFGAGDFVLGQITAAGDSISLTAFAGALVDGNAGSPNLTSRFANLFGATGIGVADALELVVQQLTNATTQTGSINVNAAGNVILTTIVAGTAASGDGDVNINATGSITLLDVRALGDTVTLTAGTSIAENGGGGVDIQATTLVLNAVTGIGVADPIDTTVTTLTAVSTGTGNVQIVETDGMTVTNASAGTAAGADGNLSLTSTTGDLVFATASALGDIVTLSAAAGKLVDGNGAANNISSGSASLLAATGIGAGDALETTVATLTSASSTAGNVEIAESDGLTVIAALTGGAGAGDGNILISTATGTLSILDITAQGDSVTLTASAGAIADGDVGGPDIDAASATLTAGTSIGAGDALETVVTNLTATAAAGDVAIVEADGATLVSIAAGGALPGDGNIDISTTAGSLSLGTLTASSDSITLAASGGGGQLIDINGGAANLTALNLSLSADAGIGLADALEIDATTVVSATTTAGDVRLGDANDVAIGTVSAAGTVELNAAGALTDGNGGGVNVTAATAVLTAGTGIGAGDAFETTIGTLSTATSAAGAIRIVETDDLALGSVSAAGNTVDITAGGAITDGNGAAVNVSAQDATLTAVTGIGAGDAIETTVATLTLLSTGAGDVSVVESDGMTLTSASAGTAAVDGNLSVTSTTGNLVVGTATALADDVTLIAIAGSILDNNAAANNVTAATMTLTAGVDIGAMADPFDVTVTGAMTLTAGGQIFLSQTGNLTLGLVTSTGALSLSASGDIIDGNGAAVNVIAPSATLTAGGTIGILGPDGAIETTVGTLAASTTAGSIAFAETDGVALGSITAGGAGNDVNLAAGGAITDGNGAAVNLSASTATLAGGSGIGAGDALETALTTLTSATTTAGDIALAEADGITVTVATAGAAGAGDGNVVISTATGALNILDVTALGDAVTLTATAGAITDGDAGGPDVSAATATLTAGTTIGVGGMDGAIDTTVTTLTATSGAGDIAIAESDGATLQNVSAGTGVAGDGSIVISTAAGDLSLGTLSAGGDAITLTANAAGAQITDANAGANNLTALNLSLSADAGIGAADALETDAGTLVSATTVAGDIRITEAGDLGVGGVSAAGSVVELIAAGALTDANGGGINVTAASATLTSGTGIGAADALETTLATLTSATSAAGAIRIVETDGLAIGTVSAAGNTVDLTAGAITDANGGAVNVTGATATLTAATGIGAGDAIETQVDTLTAVSTGAGDVAIAEADGLTLASASAGTAAVDGNLSVTSTTGNIVVGTASALADDVTLIATAGSIVDGNGAASNVSAATMTLTAGGDIGAGADPFDVTVTGLVGLTAGGQIFLAQSGDLTLGLASAVGTVSLSATGAIVDGNAAGNNVNAPAATLTAGTSIGILGADGALETTVTTLSASTVAGGIAFAEADAVTLASLVAGGAGDITVTNGGGADITLGTLDAAGNAIALTAAGGLVDGNGGAVNLTASTATLASATGIGAGDALETALVTVVSATTTAGNIELADADGITLTTVTAGGVGSVVVSSAAGDIVLGAVTADGDAVTLNAAGGIVDGNGAGVNIDVGAGSATLTGGTGIGAADALETTIGTLASATTANGAIAIADTNDLAIGVVSAAGNAVTLSAAGALTDANGGAVNITGASATLGAVTGIGAGDALETTLDSLSATSTGTGDVQIVETDGVTVLAASAGTAAAGDGNVTISTTVGDLALGTVTANADVVTLSAGGALTDANGAAANVVTGAGTTTLSAGGGIGAADALETQVGTFTSVTAGGGVQLIEADGATVTAVTAGTAAAGDGGITVATTAGGLVVGSLTALGDAVTLAAAGALTDGNGAAVNVSGASASLGGSDVSSGDALETAVATLSAAATAGSVNVAEADAVTLASVTAAGAGSDVTVTAGGAMTVGTVAAPDAVSLTSTAALLDDANGTTRISAASATLSATDIGGADALETAVGTLDANASAGGVGIAELDAITLASVIANGAGNDVTVTAGGNVTVATVRAPDVVSITTGGAILDDAAGATSLGAATANLTAADIASADALETQVGTLNAATTAGSINIAELDAIALATVSAAGVGADVSVSAGGVIAVGTVAAPDRVALTSTAAIVDDASSNTRITAATAVLSATDVAGGDALETGVDTLTATATAGSVNVNELDAVTLASVSASGSVASDVTVRAGGEMTVGSVSATRVAALTSTGGALVDGNGAGMNLTAAAADLASAGDIGTQADPFETSVGTLQALSSGGVFATEANDVLLATIIAGGGIGIENLTGDMRLGTLQSGASIALTASGGSIRDENLGLANLTAASGQRSTLTASGVVGTRADPIDVVLDPGELAVGALSAEAGVSVAIDGVVNPSNALIVLGAPPGLVLFNGAPGGGGIGGLGSAGVPGLGNSGTLDAIATSNPSLAQLPFGFDESGLYDFAIEPDDDELREMVEDETDMSEEERRKRRAQRRQKGDPAPRRRTSRPAIY